MHFHFGVAKGAPATKLFYLLGKAFLEIKTKQHKVIKCSVITRKHHIKALVLRSQMWFSLKPKELEQ